MTVATQIVDNLLGETVDHAAMLRELGDVIDRENKLRELAKAENLSFNFGFYISTGNAEYVESNMKDDGVDTESPAFWTNLADDWIRLETNMLKIIRKNGLSLRPEGHSDGGDLAGSAWLYLYDNGSLNEKGIDLMRSMVESDEPLTTGSGSITTLEGFDSVYEGVDKRLAKACELSFGVFSTEKIKRFYEFLDNGTPMEEILKKVGMEESFLAPPEPPGIFRKIVDGTEIFSARCPGCKRIHGNFKTYEQAAGNRQCKFCTRDFVDKMTKVTTTGNFKHLLKKDHEARASRSYR